MFKKILIITLIVITGALANTALVIAQDNGAPNENGDESQTTSDVDILENLGKAGIGAEYDVANQASDHFIPGLIGQIVALVLGFVGTIFFIMIIFSGFQWMTAGGNEEKVTKARTRMINSTIGMAITTAAYFITWLIKTTLLS